MSSATKIGYARVSTDDQRLDLQRDALLAAGCNRIFEDKASGARTTRPGLDQVLSHLRAGDTLVIWRLDRLGRTTINLSVCSSSSREMELSCNRFRTGSTPRPRSDAQ